ncbi:MAG: hypothetical protein QXY45_01240 [Candidatus Aenigmatarchaeota archaeon]
MKAQISTEFIVYFLIILFFGAFFLSGHLSTKEKLSYLKNEKEVDEFLDRIVFEINSATIAGDGYERRFYLEDTLAGYSNYKITIQNYSVFLDWGNRSKSSTIITPSVNGSFKKGWNTIRNLNGVLYVN